MDEGELKLFRAVAERDPPKRRVRELWAVVGRRGGKDSVASAVACFASGFIDYKKVLRPGERASVLCLAVDKAQASIVEKYTRAYFADVPLLRGQVTRETADGLELNDRGGTRRAGEQFSQRARSQHRMRGHGRGRLLAL